MLSAGVGEAAGAAPIDKLHGFNIRCDILAQRGRPPPPNVLLKHLGSYLGTAPSLSLFLILDTVCFPFSSLFVPRQLSCSLEGWSLSSVCIFTCSASLILLVSPILSCRFKVSSTRPLACSELPAAADSDVCVLTFSPFGVQGLKASSESSCIERFQEASRCWGCWFVELYQCQPFGTCISGVALELWLVSGHRLRDPAKRRSRVWVLHFKDFFVRGELCGHRHCGVSAAACTLPVMAPGMNATGCESCGSVGWHNTRVLLWNSTHEAPQQQTIHWVPLRIQMFWTRSSTTHTCEAWCMFWVCITEGAAASSSITSSSSSLLCIQKHCSFEGQTLKVSSALTPSSLPLPLSFSALTLWTLFCLVP